MPARFRTGHDVWLLSKEFRYDPCFRDADRQGLSRYGANAMRGCAGAAGGDDRRVSPRSCIGQAGYMASMQYLAENEAYKGYQVGGWTCQLSDHAGAASAS